MSIGNRLTREEFKKAKVIEEARKAGTLPAEIDEEGREINPHIPQYIAQAPWYLSSNAPSLKHQRKYQEEIVLNYYYINYNLEARRRIRML